MKPRPPTTAPRAPPRRRAIRIASWVEAGPGRRLHAATASSNSCWSIPPRSSTTRRRSSAICVGGPPKPVTPMRVHWSAIVRSGTISAAPSGISPGRPASVARFRVVRDALERGAVEPVDLPLLEPGGADLGVEVERRRVPIERGPLEPRVAARASNPRQVRDQRATDAGAPASGRDVEILEPDTRTALPGREGQVEQREPGGLPRRFVTLAGLGDHGLGGRLGPEQRILE